MLTSLRTSIVKKNTIILAVPHGPSVATPPTASGRLGAAATAGNVVC